jgi:phosphonoacetate hydrolase
VWAEVADCVVPSFTNPNNLSIVTGAPPSVHGICGNYLYDVRPAGTEVMMNDPKWLRAPTIAGRAGRCRQGGAPWSPPRTSCAALLGHKMKGHLLFFRKGRSGARLEENGITDVLALVGKPVPSVYSADLSEFVFAAGVKLMADEVRPT